MNYKVTIDFKKGESFGTEVQAMGEASAISKALKFARDCGYSAPVKKSVAVQLQGAA